VKFIDIIPITQDDITEVCRLIAAVADRSLSRWEGDSSGQARYSIAVIKHRCTIARLAHQSGFVDNRMGFLTPGSCRLAIAIEQHYSITEVRLATAIAPPKFRSRGAITSDWNARNVEHATYIKICNET
jgi:hypothetical protein